jgi:hypothetical protein
VIASFRRHNEIASHVSPVHWGVLNTANIALEYVIPALMASKNEHVITVKRQEQSKRKETWTGHHHPARFPSEVVST